MQIVILAAGMGRRLGEFTKNNTKCMLPVNGKRLIDRTLRQVTKYELSRIVMVIGYKGQNVRDYLGDNYSGVPIIYIENKDYDKTNNIYSLALAKDYLQQEDTLLIESDLIFSDAIFEMVMKSQEPNLALVAKYEPWMDGTMVRIDSEYNIVNFVPKEDFNYAEIDSYYKTVNVYKLSKEFSRDKYVPFLEAYCRAYGNNSYYEQVLTVIAMIGHMEMKALPIGNAKWYEIDDAADLDIAETLFSEENQLQKYSKRYGGYWRFPQILDYCYLVNPYFPPQKMVEELKSNFSTLLTEYPSGMGVNSLLASKYFGLRKDYVVVGNGAAELIKSLMGFISGNVGVVFPTFEEYPNRLAKERVISYVPQSDEMRYDVKQLTDFFSDKDVSAILLVNPDNPSGNFIPLSDVLVFSDWCLERSIRLVLDESFVDFSDSYEDNTALHDDVLESHPNLVVAKSISKSYGVPGLRLGIMASADNNLIGWMQNDVAIWNINSFAEYYMQIFGKYAGAYKKACRLFVEERHRFSFFLQQIDYLHVMPSQANFFLCEVTSRYTSTELAQLLLSRYNILIKDCSTKNGLQGRNLIRIAIRNQRDNDMLVKALNELKES